MALERDLLLGRLPERDLVLETRLGLGSCEGQALGCITLILTRKSKTYE